MKKLIIALALWIAESHRTAVCDKNHNCQCWSRRLVAVYEQIQIVRQISFAQVLEGFVKIIEVILNVQACPLADLRIFEICCFYSEYLRFSLQTVIGKFAVFLKSVNPHHHSVIRQ